MDYNILAMVEPISSDEMDSDGLDDYVCFLIDPDVVYPATLSRLKMRGEKDFGQELFDGIDTFEGAKNLIAQANRLNASDDALALVPNSEVLEKNRKSREKVLELARRWFSRALRIAVGKPIGVKIQKSKVWKL